jgi:hypothetical protein
MVYMIAIVKLLGMMMLTYQSYNTITELLNKGLIEVQQHLVQDIPLMKIYLRVRAETAVMKVSYFLFVT